ncbi:MAG: winged helix-turn-helix domain-containing protein [Rhizomicrobium sp.]
MAKLEQEAPFAYEGLDRIFHEKARLGIVSSLAGHADGLGFSDLKSLCGLTDGNLSRHLQVLEEAGYVDIEKGYDGKRPCTRCRLTAEGRARFSDYLGVLEQVLRKATKATARANGVARAMSGQPG